MAGPSHLSQGGSYITHSSRPPLHPGRRWPERVRGRVRADAGGLLFNLAATQQSATHLSPDLKVILNCLTHIYTSIPRL